MKKSNRRVVVFVTLITVLTFTSALLLALAPAPLTPNSSSSLFAVDSSSDAMEAIFKTQVTVKSGRWKYIYVHHSKTPSGNALTLSQSGNGADLSDHFVIGNGDGAIDGEIQVGQRWNQQRPAGAPSGAQKIDPECISICLIGDFDRSVPTPTQLHRLGQLVNAIQARFDMPAGKVVLLGSTNSEAGMGRYFPLTAFREQLLP